MIENLDNNIDKEIGPGRIKEIFAEIFLGQIIKKNDLLDLLDKTGIRFEDKNPENIDQDKLALIFIFDLTNEELEKIISDLQKEKYRGKLTMDQVLEIYNKTRNISRERLAKLIIEITENKIRKDWINKHSDNTETEVEITQEDLFFYLLEELLKMPASQALELIN